MIKDGFINTLKPTGMTSNDLVAKIRGMIRRGYGEKVKVGHTGTLDPNAAGVMLVAIGRATKFTRYVTEKQKTYIAEILLGKCTDTLDTYGKIEAEQRVKEHTDREIIDVLNTFSGRSMQTPPKFSALQIDGQRLYKLAREGKETPQIPSRPIEIDRIRLLDREENTLRIEVTCSAGTYIRTLAKDIGERLGEPATLAMLLRTDVDGQEISDSFTIEELEQKIENKRLDEAVQDIDDILLKYPSLSLSSGIDLYANGAKIRAQRYLGQRPSEGLYRVYYQDRFIGIGRVTEEEEIYLKSETLTR